MSTDIRHEFLIVLIYGGNNSIKNTVAILTLSLQKFS